jgi:hypothetical protein
MSWTLDDWSIEEALFKEICDNIPKGSTILELGSGGATSELAKAGYTMFSVEDNPGYLNKHPSTYIHAPMKRFGNLEWYDLSESSLPKEYAFLLIDGPGYYNRREMIRHMDIFNSKVPMVVDDCQMCECVELADALVKLTGRPTRYIVGRSKKWAWI